MRSDDGPQESTAASPLHRSLSSRSSRESAPGAGSTLEVRLPISPGAVPDTRVDYVGLARLAA